MSLDRIESDFDREVERLGVRIKDMDQLKVRDDVFDEVTLMALYKLVHKGWITAIGGSISTGKEANVFFGERGEGDFQWKEPPCCYPDRQWKNPCCRDGHALPFQERRKMPVYCPAESPRVRKI